MKRTKISAEQISKLEAVLAGNNIMTPHQIPPNDQFYHQQPNPPQHGTESDNYRTNRN